MREKTTSSILKSLANLVEEICIFLDCGLAMELRLLQNLNQWIQKLFSILKTMLTHTD
nr:MAG TPA: hypothetical protein [Caudoviricetes sp.]